MIKKKVNPPMRREPLKTVDSKIRVKVCIAKPQNPKVDVQWNDKESSKLGRSKLLYNKNVKKLPMLECLRYKPMQLRFAYIKRMKSLI